MSMYLNKNYGISKISTKIGLNYLKSIGFDFTPNILNEISFIIDNALDIANNNVNIDKHKIFASFYEMLDPAEKHNLDVIKNHYYEYRDVVSFDMNIAFLNCCIYGRLDVAKWIYSLGIINIRDKCDMVFIRVCRCGRTNVAEWLCTLCDKYKINVTIEHEYDRNKSIIYRTDIHTVTYKCESIILD